MTDNNDIMDKAEAAAINEFGEKAAEPIKNMFILGFIRGYKAAEDIRQDGDLNEILKECAKLRGVYRLQHRTLKEFDWFVSTIIFKTWANPGPDYAEAAKLKKYAGREIKNDENALLEWGKLFLEYSREEFEAGDAEE